MLPVTGKLCAAKTLKFGGDLHRRTSSWFSDYDASQGSVHSSEYSGACEYTQQALYVWQNQGFWGLRTWQQQNDPNWRLVNRTIQTAAWLSVGGVGLAATGAYGIPAAIADLNAKITAGLGSLYTQTGQYIVAKYVAYSTTAGYGVNKYSAQAIVSASRGVTSLINNTIDYGRLTLENVMTIYIRNKDVINASASGFYQGFFPTGIPNLGSADAWYGGYFIGLGASSYIFK